MTTFLVKLRELSERIDRLDVPYWLPRYREQQLQLEKCGFEFVPLSRFISSLESGTGIYELSEETGWRYFNVNNITSMGIDDANCEFVSSPPDENATNILRLGDVVTGRVGTIGIFCKYTLNMPAYISDNVFRIRLKDCNVDYILAVLNSSIIQNQIEREVKGSLQRVVNKQTIRNLLIPIPPREVQARIVAELDAAYAAKRKADKKAAELLASIDDFVLDALGIPPLPPPDTSLPARIFTVSSRDVADDRLDPYYYQRSFRITAKTIAKDARLTRLGSVGTFVRGVTYSAEDEAPDGFAILRASNVKLETGEIDLSDLLYVRKELVFDDSQLVKQGDILICAASGSKEHAGKVAYVEPDLKDTYIGGFMTVLRVNKTIVNPRYAAVYMQSQLFRRLILRHLGGTNINNVSLSLLNSLPILIPERSVQEEIVARVSAIRTEARTLKAEAVANLAAAKSRIEKQLLT